jgi:hypothetical protein
VFTIDEETGQAGIDFNTFVASMDKLKILDKKIHWTESKEAQKLFDLTYDNRYAISKSGWASTGKVWLGPQERVGFATDAALVPGLVTAGVLGKTPKFWTKSGAKDLPILAGDFESIKAFKSAYNSFQDIAPKAETTQYAHAYATYAGLKQKYPLLLKQVEVKVGQVSFGKPLVFSAVTKKLNVPAEWQAQYQVFWLQLAVSLHDFSADEIKQLTFLVSTPGECVAAELAPFKVEREVDTKRDLQTPEVKIEHQGTSVSIGKIMEEEVTYKNLIPTLLASGLQESDFSWSMTDDAIHQGSHRFIVILLVPKHLKTIDLKFQVAAKTKSLFTQGDVLTTEPALTTINLRQ